MLFRSKALSNLTAYASSSEGEEEDEEEEGEGKEADNSGLGEEDNKDEGELPSISATLSGLAEIARSLGMVPSE